MGEQNEIPAPEQNGKTIAQTKAQVNEVVGIMRVNIEKVLERDQNLSELDRRADNLETGAAQFQQQTARIHRKYWFQNMKMMAIIIVLAIILIIIIIVWATSG